MLLCFDILLAFAIGLVLVYFVVAGLAGLSWWACCLLVVFSGAGFWFGFAFEILVAFYSLGGYFWLTYCGLPCEIAGCLIVLNFLFKFWWCFTDVF